MFINPLRMRKRITVVCMSVIIIAMLVCFQNVMFINPLRMRKRITVVCLLLQRSYVVNDIRKRLNSEVDIVRVENGAYRPLKKTLSTFLTHVSSFRCVQ